MFEKPKFWITTYSNRLVIAYPECPVWKKCYIRNSCVYDSQNLLVCGWIVKDQELVSLAEFIFNSTHTCAWKIAAYAPVETHFTGEGAGCLTT